MTDLVGHYTGVGCPVPRGLYPSIQIVASYIYQRRNLKETTLMLIQPSRQRIKKPESNYSML